MTTRQQIRDQAKSQIEGQYSGLVVTSRTIDATDYDEFVSVAITSALPNQQGLVTSWNASLMVSAWKTGVVDDAALDAILDQAIAGLNTSPTLNGLVWGLIPDSISYTSETGQQHSRVEIIYDCQYQP